MDAEETGPPSIRVEVSLWINGQEKDEKSGLLHSACMGAISNVRRVMKNELEGRKRKQYYRKRCILYFASAIARIVERPSCSEYFDWAQQLDLEKWVPQASVFMDALIDLDHRWEKFFDATHWGENADPILNLFSYREKQEALTIVECAIEGGRTYGEKYLGTNWSLLELPIRSCWVLTTKLPIPKWSFERPL